MPFQIDQQIEHFWCWAAVSSGVDRYYSPGSFLEQCQVAADVLQDDTVCANPSAHNVLEQLQDALAAVKRLADICIGPPPFDLLKTEIDAGRPVCIRIGWFDGGAHFVAACGYKIYKSGLRTIDIADPFYPDSTQDFDLFPSDYHGGGDWTATFFTKP